MRYYRQVCIHCGREFAKNDDVVVCPDCGTPHHRECWNELGGCVNAKMHGEGFKYSVDSNQDSKTVCPRCAKENPQDALFCNNCGLDLTAQGNKRGFEQGAGNPGNSAPAFFSYVMKDPYEDSTETLDDVPLSKISKYIGVKSGYYIPRFLKLKDRKIKASWNWAAFLMPSCVWFYYRKCYLFGTLAALFYTFINVLFNGFLTNFSKLSELYLSGQTAAFFESTKNALFTSQSIAYFSMVLVFKLLVGFFGNNLYKTKVISDIKNGREYSGTSILSPIIGYYAFTFVPNIILSIIK